jgi:hypothetical protein
MLNHNAELSKLGKEVGEGLAHARGRIPPATKDVSPRDVAAPLSIRGYRVEYIKLDDGSKLRPEDVEELVLERGAVLAGWRKLC